MLSAELSITICKYCMYCHLLYVNKQFVINDELLLVKSNQESGPFLIPLVVVAFGTTISVTSNCCLSAKDYKQH